MFRRTLNILMSIVLLVATTGISVSKHYCGSSLRSVSLMSTPDSCCDDRSCCHNETQVYSVDDDFVIAAAISVTDIPFSGYDLVAPDQEMLSAGFYSVPVIVCGEYYQPPPYPGDYLPFIQVFLL